MKIIIIMILVLIQMLKLKQVLRFMIVYIDFLTEVLV